MPVEEQDAQPARVALVVGLDCVTPTFDNCTFSRNTADPNESSSFGRGGAMMLWCTADATIRNSIIWGNAPDQVFDFRDTNQCDPNICLAGSSEIRDSDYDGSWGGDGSRIFNQAPKFESWQTDDLRLKTTSPFIDQGNDCLLPADVCDLDGDENTSEQVPLDLAGNPRVADSTEGELVPSADCKTATDVDMGAYELQGAASVRRRTLSALAPLACFP